MSVLETNAEAERYLNRFPDVRTFIKLSEPEIEKAFGAPQDLKLEVFRECCNEHLFVKIQTPLDVDAAMSRLDAFDKEWWFAAPIEIHKYLEFALEFV